MPEIVSNCYETEKNRHLASMHVHRHNLIFFCIIMLGGKKYGINYGGTLELQHYFQPRVNIACPSLALVLIL